MSRDNIHPFYLIDKRSALITITGLNKWKENILNLSNVHIKNNNKTKNYIYINQFTKLVST